MINHVRWLILWVCVLASGAVIAQAPPIPISNGGTGHSTGQIDLQAAFLTQQAANAASTGTTVNRLAKLSSTGAVILGTGDTSIGNLIGICASGCGTTSSGQFATAGTVPADFDNATVAGDYVVASVTTGGKVHDAGATLPTGVNVVGFADSTNGGGAGTYALNINPVGIANATGTALAPGGSNNQIQYKTGGALGGFTMSGDCTVVVGTGVITCTKTSGSAFGALATTSPGTGVATAAGNNLSAAGGLSTTIASGTSALNTGAIASATCDTVVTTSAPNTATTDVIWWGFNGDPTAVTGYVPLTSGMLTIISYPSSGNVNFKVCNNTTASITPGAITLNWRVVR